MQKRTSENEMLPDKSSRARPRTGGSAADTRTSGTGVGLRLALLTYHGTATEMRESTMHPRGDELCDRLIALTAVKLRTVCRVGFRI